MENKNGLPFQIIWKNIIYNIEVVNNAEKDGTII